MKTAEEMINDFSVSHPHVRAKDVVALLMREYAKQVAKEALKDASECITSFEHDYYSDSILNTKIKTP